MSTTKQKAFAEWNVKIKLCTDGTKDLKFKEIHNDPQTWSVTTYPSGYGGAYIQPYTTSYKRQFYIKKIN